GRRGAADGPADPSCVCQQSRRAAGLGVGAELDLAVVPGRGRRRGPGDAASPACRRRPAPAYGILMSPSSGGSAMRHASWALLLIGLVAALSVSAAGQNKGEGGYTTIFNGKDLTGWHVSAETGHSRVSKNKSGGRWVVEEGAIVGSQDVPGNGGILITEKEFGDFEVALQMRNDFGPDSGLFLRSNDRGQAHQAMIDYHPGGNLMGVYGEGLS